MESKGSLRPTLVFCGGLVLLYLANGYAQTTNVESLKLPSGEILENRTSYDPEGTRQNKLLLKNATTGTSELIGDFDYEAGKDDPSLLAKFRHPQEFFHGDEKALVIGPYICERWNSEKSAYWYIASFDTAAATGEAGLIYLQSFLRTNDAPADSFPANGPAGSVHFVFDQLDLTNHVLTVKKTHWDERYDFPDYLVYSASGFKFPWKFDATRTKAKNGARWNKPMPFKMTLDFSVIFFPLNTNTPPKEERASALARLGAKEIFATTLELSDTELRHTTCKYSTPNNHGITETMEAMYGFACLQPDRFYIVRQPHDPARWEEASLLKLDEWTEVSASEFAGNLGCEQFIRLRRSGP